MVAEPVADEEIEPEPDNAKVPAVIVVVPVYPFVPVRVCVPLLALSVSPPLPLMSPPKLPPFPVIVSVLPPRVTAPLPDSVMIEVTGAVTAAMLNVPVLLTVTPLDKAIEPEPDNARVSPEPIAVAPV